VAVLRLASAALVALFLVPAGHAARRPLAAPTDLKAFLLRADESPAHEFPRTPAFAWRPVKGAHHYEFTLSTSPLSSSSGLLWDDSSVTTPATAVRISLPWITGNPYSLYARVRAIAANGSVGKWSIPFGFNVRWANVPAQLSAAPGLVRWTSVEGATAYQVWYLNADVASRSKLFYTTTNVADEREYYTFHQNDPMYMGTVRWRVRAVRTIYGKTANKLPATTYGPWSPIFTSTNPSFLSGPLAPLGTISDSSYTAVAPGAHKLMPAFLFTGDRNTDGSTSELYRVYVYTDRDCVNLVFKSAIIGGPAYAPRSSGPLALPHDNDGIAQARTSFLPDGNEGSTFTFDGQSIIPTESEEPSTFTVPVAGGSGGGGTPTTDPNAFPEKLVGTGAPIDLWDTQWPEGGYYWTVVGVDAVTREAVLIAPASSGATVISVSAPAAFQVGDDIFIGVGIGREGAKISKISGTQLTLSNSLLLPHAVGDVVVRQTGSIDYFDNEVVQDVCATGRMSSFGKVSEPALSTSTAPFVSGLSPSGRLVAAAGPKPRFYGQPVVAWKPALGATAYELQVSKTRYPWRAIGLSYFTFTTSATLPLTPGTWWYRVRGIDVSLPTGAQQMSWSDPVGIVVAKPKFRIVRR
jgi:hypothetical protein